MPDPIRNPYVGPRSFEEEDSQYFCGRGEEIRQLTSLLISHPVVLFYAPSGAGKTSLLKAGVIPGLKKHKNLRVLPVTRVGGDPPPGVDGSQVGNIYAFNALVNLAGTRAQPDKLVGLRLWNGLQPFLQRQTEDQRLLPQLLVLDQFEELFTTHPDRYKERAEFFLQLQECLVECPQLGLLLSMREDYIACLDYYSGLMPDRLRTRFRMDLLSSESAETAVKEPAKRAHRPFGPGVAEALVDNLRRLQLRRKRGVQAPTETELGTFVEPVHLQIVCQHLWEKLPANRSTILAEDVRDFGDVDQALTTFYREKLGLVVKETQVSEHHVRGWFDDNLITPDRTRGLVYRGETETEGLPNAAVDILYKEYIVRTIQRGNDLWYELAHDRLVEPVLTDNAAWRQTNLSVLQRQADLWKGQGNTDRLLLRDAALREAERWARMNQKELTPIEREFLNRCRQVQTQTRYIRGLVLSVSFLFLSFLFYSFYNYYSGWLVNRPWGYFRNLSTGTVHLLKNELASIGRTTDDIINQVDVPPNVVSRLHLFIFRNLFALDMRSVNGTIINSQFLPYGESAKLENGDVIVLAGIAPFQFEKIEYSRFQLWTPSRSFKPPADSDWGILIDGASKSWKYLNAPRYFLSVDLRNRIICEEKETDNTFFTIQKNQPGISERLHGLPSFPAPRAQSEYLFEARGDGMRYAIKNPNYDYGHVRGELTPGEKFRATDNEVGGVIFNYKALSFQIVSLSPFRTDTPVADSK